MMPLSIALLAMGVCTSIWGFDGAVYSFVVVSVVTAFVIAVSFIWEFKDFLDENRD